MVTRSTMVERSAGGVEAPVDVANAAGYTPSRMSALRDVPPAVRAWVVRMHDVVDELASGVAQVHGDRLRCREGCSGCCQDGLTVFEIEAAVIAERHGELLRGAAPNPGDGCAFLDGRGACRIYADRPYVCRTQGLPLRWLEQDDGGNALEARDICPLSEEGPPLEELEASALWSVGPFEERLAAQQAAVDGGEGRRVALRALFAGHAERAAIVRLPMVR